MSPNPTIRVASELAASRPCNPSPVFPNERGRKEGDKDRDSSSSSFPPLRCQSPVTPPRYGIRLMMRVKPKSYTTVHTSNLQPIEEDNKMCKRNVLSQKLSIFGTSRGEGGIWQRGKEKEQCERERERERERKGKGRGERDGRRGRVNQISLPNQLRTISVREEEGKEGARANKTLTPNPLSIAARKRRDVHHIPRKKDIFTHFSFDADGV